MQSKLCRVSYAELVMRSNKVWLSRLKDCTDKSLSHKYVWKDTVWCLEAQAVFAIVTAQLSLNLNLNWSWSET